MTVETERDLRARPLSLAQEQLWFLDQLAPGEATYTILMVWRLRGRLRTGLLHRALNLIVARHESLRVTFGSDEGAPYQIAAPAADVALPVVDLSDLPPAERQRRAEAEVEALYDQPYDLETGPLYRFRLLRLADDEHILCQGYHHTIIDGWSAALINDELSAAYRSLVDGAEPDLPAVELDFTTYAASQRARLTGATLTQELAFWKERLAGLPVLDLPADRPRPVGGRHAGDTVIREYPAELRELVHRLAEQHGASAFMVLTAACTVLLSRYTAGVDVPLGVPMLGRPEPELESVVGMFVTMSVLRADLSGDPSFAELIDRIADGTLDLYEHQEVAFHQIVEAVAPARDADRNPLFDVSIQLLGGNNSGENLRLPGVAAEYLPQSSRTSRFDMAINVIDTGSTLRANVEYSSELFDRWRMEAMLDHLETVLRRAAADPSVRVSAIPLVTGAERDALLAAGEAAGAYVVDGALNLMPRGVPGDLVPALAEDAPRTGERGRWTPDLRLERVPAPQETTPASVRQASPAELSETEQKVAAIFGEVLTLPAVGADDNFFDIGGNSLQAMRVISRVNKGFGIKLSVRSLYGNASVRAISAAVEQKLAELS
ncbi:condensation domain-containing protein [Actinoplanes teichomyceticus]|uniref:Phosphopantetheine binding protein n=1 Tax=Actinoplanes teichomyceticus TaxID=1867 RepID=A0A561WK06_ACTTI|nr:condensation domain-containing protein [Actinoplanes teichomyceticus]TWG24195.1 phosphopantetheine binding protein [Actinoplanes teichomyceticus]GIF12958.1 hypothetical protein Ate01nite_29900 [Actinoplanes teichomyceticus]